MLYDHLAAVLRDCLRPSEPVRVVGFHAAEKAMPPGAPQTQSRPQGVLSGSGITLGRIMGITVRVDWSWVIIFTLITLMTSTQFKVWHEGWSEAQHWSAGIVTSLLFFVCIFLHEMGHSVVAKTYGIEVSSITLFIFGGVASIKREPKRPGEEFFIAIAGPLVSLALAVLFFVISGGADPANAKTIVRAIAAWVCKINILLIFFNMLPGFPLDGGRVLRSIVWKYTGDFDRSTRIAGTVGQVVAYLLILYGVFRFFGYKDFVGGIWLAFIGWFLLKAAQGSIAQVALRQVLGGVKAADIMDISTPYVSPAMSVQQLVDDYVLHHGLHRFLVFDGDQLRGLVTLTDVKQVPREDWHTTSLQAIMRPCEQLHTVRPQESLERVMQRMDEYGVNQLPVVEQGIFYGLVTRETIVRLFRSRMEFGG